MSPRQPSCLPLSMRRAESNRSALRPILGWPEKGSRCQLLTQVFSLLLAVIPAVPALSQSSVPVPDELRTVAERSEFTATSTSQEVEDFLARCDQLSERIRCVEFGRTVEGKPMTAAILAKGDFELGQKDSRFRALVIGNIHSGECDGKEALLEIIRNFALQPNQEWLDQMVLVIAPNYNADGNDKMAKTNRPGQVGPDAGMGYARTLSNSI